MRIGVACEGGPPPDELLDLLSAAGLPTESLHNASPPGLVSLPGGAWFLGSAGDVLRACDRGALDTGVVGSDYLLEARFGVADLLDLRCCRDDLVVAVTAAGGRPDRRLRVATRHPRAARRHFAATGAQPELVIMDEPALAPALGLAEGVIELRRRLGGGPSGGGLDVWEVVTSCSMHLVAGRAARVLLRDELATLIDRLRSTLEER